MDPYLQIQASNFLTIVKQEEEKRGSQLELNPGNMSCSPMRNILIFCGVPSLIKSQLLKFIGIYFLIFVVF